VDSGINPINCSRAHSDGGILLAAARSGLGPVTKPDYLGPLREASVVFLGIGVVCRTLGKNNVSMPCPSRYTLS
jgi:hypothetical protein